MMAGVEGLRSSGISKRRSYPGRASTTLNSPPSRRALSAMPVSPNPLRDGCGLRSAALKPRPLSSIVSVRLSGLRFARRPRSGGMRVFHHVTQRLLNNPVEIDAQVLGKKVIDVIKLGGEGDA